MSDQGEMKGPSARDMFPDYPFPKWLDLTDTEKAVRYVGMHEDGKPFSIEKLRQLIEVRTREYDKPYDLLRSLWEFDLEHLPEGPDKEQLMTIFDKRVMELFAGEIINLPDQDEVENQKYQPAARLAAIHTAVSDFPFARAESREKIIKLANHKKQELGIE